jgi:hypothetical protein
MEKEPLLPLTELGTLVSSLMAKQRDLEQFNSLMVALITSEFAMET